ncbi:MAG: hypothetical protein A3F80_06475 [Candidatus Melainabacteria bacterium RIFCSPLOWO2_12_FULL_35_11]|nr:MAG: hypothetical protein A3F80_06475 [Candidatus Melainabacteria bacterium RIFCSPLOWO2_12_FULL_35_11]
MSKTLKLYIDTSVWNHVLESERDNHKITNDFFSLSSEDNYLLVISNLVISEVSTIKGVHNINFKEGYGMIEIVSPNQFLGK